MTAGNSVELPKSGLLLIGMGPGRISSMTIEAKNAAKSAGLFLAVILVAFVLSNGVETPMRDGKVLSAMGSKLVGTGLRVFYILSIIAVGLMILPGIKNSIKK
mgnify:CR=1 FL=1